MRLFWSMVIGAIFAAIAVAGYVYFQDLKEPAAPVITDAYADFDDATYFARLDGEAYQSADSGPLSFSELNSSLLKYLAISYDTLEPASGSGAYIATNLKITRPDDMSIGLQVDTARFWGFEPDLLAARIRGERIDEELKIAERIEFDGLRAFGLETLYQPVIDATTAALEEETGVSSGGGSEPTIQDLVIEARKLLVTDIVLYPYELSLRKFEGKEDKDAESNADSKNGENDISFSVDDGEITIEEDVDIDGEEAFHLLQKVAAALRVVHVEDWALYDTNIEANLIGDDSGPISFAYTVPLSAVKNYNRGDYGLTVSRDNRFTMELSVRDDGTGDIEPAGAESEEATVIPIRIDYSADLYRIADIRLGTLLDHVARGVMPETDVTDLMSLGYWQLVNEKTAFNGRDIYAVEEARIDLTNFHWLIPARVDVDIDNVLYNIGGLIDVIKDVTAAASGESIPSAELLTIDRVNDILAQNELAQPKIDFDVSWDWDPDGGKFDGKTRIDIDDFGEWMAKADLDFPDYASVAPYIKADMTDEDNAAIEQAFENAFALNKLTFRLDDNGGLAKGFAMAVDFAEMAPDGQGADFLRGADPEDLRVSIAAMMRFGGGSMLNMIPDGKEYINKVADFVAKGGTLTLTLSPPKPLNKALIDAMAEEGEPSPEKIIKALGLELKRTP